MKLPFSIERGFTLVELTMVMAILGVLITIFVSSYPNARRTAHDSERISDVKQYQAALEVYANANNGVYPIARPANLDDLCIAGIINLNTCPTGPNGDSYVYYGDGTNHLIYSELEVTDGGSTQWFVTCSDGRSGKTTTNPAVATSCPF